MYREYTVMQPLQRSYAITDDRIDAMLASGALSGLYDEGKVTELEDKEELTGKEVAKLENYQKNKPVYDEIVSVLRDAVSDNTYKNPESFMPVLSGVLGSTVADKKLLDKIAKGLSVMDKSADIQVDKKGNVIFDTETKDAEIVKYDMDIEEYMAREVLPHVPDAKWFFEEDLGKKNPVIKTGAEIPFTRYFYKYQQPKSSEDLGKRFIELDDDVNARIKKLFGGI